MDADLIDRKEALRLILGEVDGIARTHKAQLGMIKDIHRDFPAEERAVMREAGFAEGLSLPTIRVNTAYGSFDEYLKKQLSKNGRKHARKQFHKAEGTYALRVVEDFEHLVPKVFSLYRAVFLKAKYQFEELPPRFFVECSRSTDPKTEMVICERTDGRIVGSLLIFYNDHEQQNKRIGIDYDLADSGLIYNLLNYTGIQRAISRGLTTLWLGQSSYLPKTRLGGELEDQFLLIKAYDPVLKPTLPLQRWWMSRYSAAKIQAGLENGVSI
jgi:predicted N-acyltransferase